MKKRFLSILLLVCMLATMVPFAASAATAEAAVSAPESTNADYAKLYVQSGLVHAYMAFGKSDSSYDIAKGVWYDLVGNANGTIGGGAYDASTNPYGWQVGANGGLSYTDPNLKSGGKTALQWTVGTGEGQLALPETFNVEYVASHEMRNMSQANLWVNSTVTSSAIEGSTDVLYTITMPKWNSANMMRLWVNFAGTAGAKYSISFGAETDPAALKYKKDITMGSDGTAGMNDGSGVYNKVTQFYVRVPAGLTVTSAKVLTNGNELTADGAFQIGSLRTLIWSNLNGGNSWGNGDGSVRWFVGNNNWNGGGAGCTIIESEERSFYTYEGTAITMNVLKKPATVDAGTSASYTFGYGTYTKTYTPAADSAVLKNDRFIFQQALGGTAYALRIYDRELTTEEKALNHLVDILAYARYDIAKYNKLDAATRTALAASLAKASIDGMSVQDIDNEIARIEKTASLDSTLYVQSGLVALFVADASADVANKVWYNRVAGGANATMVGSRWYETADGAVRVNGNIYGTKLPNGAYLATSSGKIGNTLAPTGVYLDLGVSLLPDHDFTIQMTASYDDIYARNFDTNLATEIWTTTLNAGESSVRFKLGFFSTWHNLTSGYGTSRYTYAGVTDPWQGGYAWDSDRNDFRNMAGEGVYTETIIRDEAADELSAVYKQLFNGSQKATWTFAQASKNKEQSNYKADESAGSFYMFQGWPANVYSVAVYDRILTDAEMKQNHAADLIEYYNIDASMITGENASESLRNFFITAAQSYKIDPANYEANRAALAAIVTPQGEMNEYDELYVQDGLTALYNAYDLDDKSVDFERGLWYNKLGEAATMGNSAVIVGRKYAYDESVSTSWGWQKGANGGFAISYTQPVWAKYVNDKRIGDMTGITLDRALIDVDDYTVEIVLEMEYLLTASGDAYETTESTYKYGCHNRFGPTFRLGVWASTSFIAKGHGGSSFGEDRWAYFDGEWANHNGNAYGKTTANFRENLGLDDITTMTLTQTKSETASNLSILFDIDASVRNATSTKIVEDWGTFAVMNGLGGVIYAIRTYDRVLDIAEMKQNHFADIAAYNKIDLTNFKKLTDEQKAQVYTYYENTQLDNSDKALVEAYIAMLSGAALEGTMYVTEGLVGMFSSFVGEDYADLGAKKWVNIVDPNTAATIQGSWTKNADGSFGYKQTYGNATAKLDYFGNVWYDRDISANNNWSANNYLDFGIAMLPKDDFTVEFVTNYHKVGLVASDGSIVDYKLNEIDKYYYRATDVATGSTSAVLSDKVLENTETTTYELLGNSYKNNTKVYINNGLADAIGFLKTFGSFGGIFEGDANYLYRWYVTDGNGGWNSSGYTRPTSDIDVWEDKGHNYSTIPGSIQTKTITREKNYTDDILTSVTYSIARNMTTTSCATYPVVTEGYKAGLHYPTGSETHFYLFKSQPLDVYAVRIYDRVLTLEEQLQNKAADLAKYYGLDLTKYNTLTDAQKAEARSELADLGFGSTKAVAQATFDAIASAAIDANGLTQYDKAYVQEGLVGLFTAYEAAETSLNIGVNTWKNKVGNDFATVVGGSNYWFRGENGGLGYHMTLSQWTAAQANGAAGIQLPESFADLKNFTVETVAETYGITNEDGSVYYNSYKPAYTDGNGFSIAASGAVFGQFSSQTAGYRFGLINALSWAAQYPGNDNALGQNRWFYSPAAYGQHSTSADKVQYFAALGQERTLLNYNYAAITTQFARATAEDGSVTFTVGANGSAPTLTGTVAAAKVAELEALTEYTKDKAGAFSLFNCIPSMVYAVRVYNRALTTAEAHQNHFVDIAAYFDLDLSKVPAGEEEIFYASFESITFAADRNYVQGLYAFMTGDKLAMAENVGKHVGYAPLLGEETGYRVLFGLDEAVLGLFGEASYKVSYGAIVGVGDYGSATVNTVEGLTVNVTNKGNTISTSAKNAKVVVVGGTDGTGVLYEVMGDLTLYSVAVTATPAQYSAGIIVRGFVSVTDSIGQTRVIYLDPAEDSALSGSVSVMEAAEYFVNEYDDSIVDAYTYMNNASLLSILATCGIPARETIADHLVLYVDAENGSDENNGLAADSAFKTIDAAVIAAKLHMKSKSSKGVTFNLAEGVYNVKQAIDLNGADFATSDYYINFVGAGADTTILDGSVVIDTSSATLDPNTGLYVVDVPGANFRYLYADGEIVPTVKMGDEENYYTINSDPVVDAEAKTAKIYMDSSLFDGYSTYKDTEVHLTIEWNFNIIHIEYVDYEDVNDNGDVAVYVDYDQFSNMAVYSTVTGRQFWLEMGYDLLVAGVASGSLESSCYYFDEATHKLYYYDADGDFASKKFAHGGIENMFYFQNIDGLNVQDLAITGIDNKYVTNDGGLRGGQAGGNGRIVNNDQGGTSISGGGFLTLAAIYGSNITNAYFTGLHIYNVGGDGLSLRDKVENVFIQSNKFEHIGETAIRIGNSTRGEASGNNYNRNVVIADNYINGTGEFFKQCCGMLITNGARIKVVGNTIVNTTYTAISIGWKWNESTLTLEQIKANNQHHLYNVEVAYNYITNFMTCMRDGGGIYILGGNAENSETSYFNFMHDNYMVVTEASGNHVTPKWFMGYYHDGASSNWYDYNNVVVNATSTGVGNFVPYYVQGIQSQLSHNVKLEGNYGIGFANGEALYRQPNRINKDRNIVANDYIFTDVSMNRYVANSIYGNSKSLTPPSNAKALVASIFMTAGAASTPTAEKPQGGLSLAGGVVNAKSYVIDGEYVGSEEIAGGLTAPNFAVNLVVDGEIVKTYTVAAGGTLTIDFADPIKAADAQYTYTFAGWDGYTAGMKVYTNMNFEATFKETVNEYTITFMNGDGEFYKVTVPYGTKVADIIAGMETPAKEADKVNTYAFTGWFTTNNSATGMPADRETVEGNKTYYATYQSNPIYYTYKVVVYNPETGEYDVMGNGSAMYNSDRQFRSGDAFTYYIGDYQTEEQIAAVDAWVAKYQPAGTDDVRYVWNHKNMKAVVKEGAGSFKYAYKDGNVDYTLWNVVITENTVFELVFTPEYKLNINGEEVWVTEGTNLDLTPYIDAEEELKSITVNGEVLEGTSFVVDGNATVVIEYVANDEPAYAIGDVDGSGTINAVDAGWIYEIIAGTRDASTALGLADLDGSGTINAVDAGWIYEIIAGARDAETLEPIA